MKIFIEHNIGNVFLKLDLTLEILYNFGIF